jgi:hypothetical protein
MLLTRQTTMDTIRESHLDHVQGEYIKLAWCDTNGQCAIAVKAEYWSDNDDNPVQGVYWIDSSCSFLLDDDNNGSCNNSTMMSCTVQDTRLQWPRAPFPIWHRESPPWMPVPVIPQL